MIVGAVQGTLVANQHAEAHLMVGHGLKDPGHAAGAVDLGELPLDILLPVDHLVVEHFGLDAIQAAEAPAGGGHGLDQVHFDAGGGLEIPEVGIAKGFEVFGGLVRQDNGFRGQSVAGAVMGRCGAAVGCGGAVRLGAVGAGGVGFGFRWRFRWHVGLLD
jgi:hypothetical protein